jgi:hypothetical protein
MAQRGFVYTKLSGDEVTQRELITHREEMERLKAKEVRALEKMGTGMWKIFFGSLISNATPYIVLILLIVMIILISRGSDVTRPIRKLNDRRKREFAKAKSRLQKIRDWIRDKLQWFRAMFRLIAPGYRVRLFIRMFLPFRGKQPTVPRYRLRSGRCDNVRWLQEDRDGQRGYCYSAIRPKDIEWELDETRLTEFYTLPRSQRERMLKKMKVYIPYTTDHITRSSKNSFFVPQCEKARYEDGTPAHLLSDSGTTCLLNTKSLTQYKKQ